jgi:sulfite reductase (NADPH) flavoprotein alpha-component
MHNPSSNLAHPVNAIQLAAFHGITDALDSDGLSWLSGYAAGIARGRATASASSLVRAPELQPLPLALALAPLTVVYGSQTGNARRVAETLAADTEAAGLPVRLLRADAYPLRELKTERHLVVVISTQGDGDPPDDARGFCEHLAGKRAPKLDQLQYAVLGLGDSSYPRFNAVSEQLDERLAELGASRLLARGAADLDVETVADPWRAQVLAKAKDALKPSATVTPLRPAIAPAASPAHGRDTPFQAQLLANQRITAHGSSKDVRHVELSIEGSGLTYEPGDALGLWPRNPQRLVEQVLQAAALDGDTDVTLGADTLPLHAWLRDRRELTRLSRPFVAAHAERTGSDDLKNALAPGNTSDLQHLLADTQVIDLLQRHAGAWSADALVCALRPLTPRLYSIASSREEAGDEVHLAVARVEYDVQGQTRWGAASNFLASREDGDVVPVYIEANERFRLPSDRARDVIMIGPGTGVAPFRAFAQHRRATRAVDAGYSGRNWLFFGNPHFRSDFLYQLEWQRALKEGTLDRIDLAFSRDGADKTYVQHRIAQRARDLYDWLQGGAHLYVCGATAMGKDVHAALINAVSAHNGGDRDAAGAYLDELARQGRYARDLY